MFMTFRRKGILVLSNYHRQHPSSMPRPVIFRGIMEGAPAHCSAPPLPSGFRLPRLSRDAEAITRPRSPLLPTKWEERSECEAVVEFSLDRADEADVKVEVEEPVEVEEAQQRLCASLSAVRILPHATAVGRPRGPGRPKGSKSRPRVEPHFDKSAPPEREKARMASARIAAMRR